MDLKHIVTNHLIHKFLLIPKKTLFNLSPECGTSKVTNTYIFV